MAVAEFDPVLLLVGDEPAVDYFAVVDLVDDEDGEPVWVPLESREERLAWPVRTYDPPLPVGLAPDLSTILRAPGAVPIIDGASIDASTLDTSAMPPVPITDGDAPAAATTVTSIGGIGSMFYRWTEIANADPVTYRLHVRAGSAPTTTGTYEVAAGVGLTSASVRKLADGTAIVGDGSVTYHAIVTVEDADGPGPASTDVSGVPAQVTTADIAVNAITANLLTANDAVFDALTGGTITGITITGADITATSTITGALYRTAVSGPRIEMGGGINSATVSFETDLVDQDFPGAVQMGAGAGESFITLQSPGQTSHAGTAPAIRLSTRTAASEAEYWADRHTFHTGPIDADLGNGTVGTGTLRTSVDGRVSAVAPTVTMTTGSVGTGTFRDSVDARADARIAAKVKGGSATASVAGGSGVATFTHGLGYTPSVLVPVLTSPASVREFRKVSHNATTFDVQFRDSAGTVTANGTSVTVEFIAIP